MIAAVLASLVMSLTGTPVTVECDAVSAMPVIAGLPAIAGYADLPGHVIHLRSDYCYNAYEAAIGKPDNASGGGLITLLHEDLHISLQSRDEAEVECSAIRNVWRIIARLPVSHRAKAWLWQGARDNHMGMPPNYTAVC